MPLKNAVNSFYVNTFILSPGWSVRQGSMSYFRNVSAAPMWPITNVICSSQRDSPGRDVAQVPTLEQLGNPAFQMLNGLASDLYR
jgi:hypothetical protein